MLSLVLIKNRNLFVYLIWILCNKLDLNQETCFTIWGLDLFCNFYLVLNNKIDNNSTFNEADNKVNIYLKSLEFNEYFDV